MYKAIIFDVYGTLFDMSSLKKDMVQFDDAQATSISKLWRKTQLNHMFLKQIMQRYIPFDELTKEALRYTMESHEIQYNREDCLLYTSDAADELDGVVVGGGRVI